MLLRILVKTLQTESDGLPWTNADFKSLLNMIKRMQDKGVEGVLHHVGLMLPDQGSAQEVMKSFGYKMPEGEFRNVRVINPPSAKGKSHKMLYIPEPRLVGLVPCFEDRAYFAIGWSEEVRQAHWFVDLVVENHYQNIPGNGKYQMLPTRYPDGQPLPAFRMTDGVSSILLRYPYQATCPSVWPSHLGGRR